jgi:hypothetical protein
MHEMLSLVASIAKLIWGKSQACGDKPEQCVVEAAAVEQQRVLGRAKKGQEYIKLCVPAAPGEGGESPKF